MADRRPLVEGIKGPDVPRTVEEQFVFGAKPPSAPTEPAAEAPARPAAPPVGRSPLTTRLRADLAAALKRASLERELAGVEPHTVQDMLEAALEPWLRANGYLGGAA